MGFVRVFTSLIRHKRGVLRFVPLKVLKSLLIYSELIRILMRNLKFASLIKRARFKRIL